MGGYPVTQVFVDAFNWAQTQVTALVGEWGMRGVTVLIVFAVVWKLFLRVRT